jgi:hypothetical protein
MYLAMRFWFAWDSGMVLAGIQGFFYPIDPLFPVCFTSFANLSLWLYRLMSVRPHDETKLAQESAVVSI